MLRGKNALLYSARDASLKMVKKQSNYIWSKHSNQKTLMNRKGTSDCTFKAINPIYQNLFCKLLFDQLHDDVAK